MVAVLHDLISVENITILPRTGRIGRALEKIRAVSPYTQIRAPEQIKAKAKRLEASIIRAVALIAEKGE